MRRIVKRLIYLLAIVIVSPFAVLYKLSRSGSLFAGQAQFLSLIPGKTGSCLRVAYYYTTLQRCPLDGFIGFGSYFTNPEVEMGRGVYIGAFNIIGIASIGDHATIASHVSILSGKQQHGYKEIDKPIQEQKGNFVKIAIGSNCWVGNGAIVMANLGTQNVIAAGSVIAKDTGDYEVWGGNPAVLLKKLL